MQKLNLTETNYLLPYSDTESWVTESAANL